MKNNKIKEALVIDINDGCINRIILFESHLGCKGEILEDGNIRLADEGEAIIEFSNGKKLEITNSEWCSLNWLKQ